MIQTTSQKSILTEIEDQVGERKYAAHQAFWTLTGHLLEALLSDADLVRWLYERKKPAGRTIAEVLGPNAHMITRIPGLSHNPGNNQILCLSVLWRAKEEGDQSVPERICLTVERHWYQGRYNHGMNWYQILSFAPIAEAGAFSNSSLDSHWLALVAERITSPDIALQVLQECRERPQGSVRRHG